MSFILDALKKSEHDQSVVESADADFLSRLSRESHQPKPWLSGWHKLFLAVLLLGAGTAMGAFLSWNKQTESPALPQSTAMVGVTSRQDVVNQSAIIQPSGLTQATIPPVGSALPAGQPVNAKVSNSSNPVPTIPSPPVFRPAPAELSPSLSPSSHEPVASLPSPAPITQAGSVSPKALASAGVTLPVETPADDSRFTAKVVGIKSGCLIEIQQNQELRTVQLADVVCPKPQSLAGKKARRHTAQRVFTQQVTVAFWKKAEEKVLVADVYAQDGHLLNSELIANGLAKAEGSRFQSLEKEAKAQGWGLWENPSQWLAVPGGQPVRDSVLSDAQIEEKIRTLIAPRRSSP